MGNKRFSEFETEWISLFAKNLNKTKLKKYVLGNGNYIWHIFSWELLPKNVYLEGDEARKAFNAQNRTGAKYFEPFKQISEGSSIPENPSAEDLEELVECYVISEDRSWTYIKTHEGYCGPYFCKIKE